MVDKNKQAGTRNRTMKLARKARLLYLKGFTRTEISQHMSRSIPQLARYFLMTGGISMHDKALHYKFRFLKGQGRDSENKT